MVTIDSLKKQIKREQTRLDDIKKRNELEFEKATMAKQLKMLKRSPGTTRSIQLARRTGIGLKKLATIGGKALLKQAKLIKDQQLREDRAFAKRGKKIRKTVKKTGKKLRKSSRRRRRQLTKKGPGKTVTFTIA